MNRASIAELLNIDLPIIQAPMAGSQGSGLAIAVSNAGGLGSLPCALLSADAMRRELEGVSAGTSKPYNVNFFVHRVPVRDAGREALWRQVLARYFAEYGIDSSSIADGPERLPFNHDYADVLEPFRPAVVSFHFGLPDAELVKRVKGWGSKILSSATTVDEARYLEANGVDAVIAQGLDAGGHRGMFLTEDLGSQLPMRALVPMIADAVSVPVIAAGGISTARDAQDAIALGAAGVQVGTAYLLCPEATTNLLHRAALISAAASDTAVTNLLTGRPARGIVNRVMREIGPLHPAAPPFPLAATAIVALRTAAEQQGRSDFSSLWAGQNAPNVQPAAAAAVTRLLGEAAKTSFVRELP